MDRPPRHGSVNELEDHLRDVDRALEKLYARVAALERGDHAPDTSATAQPTRHLGGLPHPGTAAGGSAETTGVLTLIGRTLVVLGGAFLLRAITESGRLPPISGVLLGVAYASTWIGAADLAAVRRPRSGLFHGLAGMVIGFPLLIEASTKFGALSAPGAATVLVGLALAILAVSWHRKLQTLATVTALAAAMTGIAGALTTGQLAPFAVAAIGIGAASSLSSLHRDWHLAAWPSALAANVLVLAIAVRAHSPAGIDERTLALTIALGLAAVYFALAIPTLASRVAAPRLGDLVRAALGLVVGMGVALVVASALGASTVRILAAALMTTGIALYAVDLRTAAVQREAASVFLVSAAVAMFCVGGVLITPGALRTLPIGVAALELVRSTRMTGRPWMYAHAAVVASAYGFSSGLATFTVDAWTGAAVAAIRPALGVAAVLLFVGVTRPAAAVSEAERWPLVTAFVPLGMACAAAGAGVLVLAGLVDGLPSSPAVLATERSVVLAISAMVLASVGKSRRDPVFRWLSYGALILGAIKLVVEDFAVSSPTGMFLAFGVYGLALIVCSKRTHED